MPQDSVHQTEENTELGLFPRIISAGWFALAACIPVGFFILAFGGVTLVRSLEVEGGIDYRTLGALWLFGEVPVVIAAFFGFTVGSRIVDPFTDTSAGRAALRGIGVAGLSYVVFMAFYIASIAVQYFSNNGDSGFLAYVILAMILVSLLTMGWLIVLSGALAGWLLCGLSCRTNFCEWLLNTPRISVTNRNVWIAIAASIVGLSCALGVLFVSRSMNTL